MDIDHVQTHTPRATMDQVYKFATFSDDKLTDNINTYSGKSLSTSAAKRFRDGYLKPSVGYEDGPPQYVKDFVAQI